MFFDIKYIREHKKEVLKGIKTKGFDADLDLLLEFDEKRRVLGKNIEELNAERKKVAEIKDVKQGREIKISLAKLESEEKLLSEMVKI